MDEHSVTHLFPRLAKGDEAAAQQLWERYSRRLLSLVSGRLSSNLKRVSDEHDVVQEAFLALFRRFREGRASELNDRRDLWNLLVTIAERRSHNAHRHLLRKKRGNGEVRGESVFLSADDSATPGLDGVAGADPTPELAAELEESLRLLLELLDEDLRRVAIYRFEGHKDAEIAELLEVSVATVERKFKRIRSLWQGKHAEAGDIPSE